MTPADVAEIAGKHAADTESGRRLNSEAVAAIVAAGFARRLVPSRWGGTAGALGPLVEDIATIGESCASTAWFTSLTASLGRMAAYLPEPGQAEIWSAGPDPVIVGALMPLGTATRVGDGWRVRGRWPYVSGIEFSDWALVCANVTGGQPHARFFAVPRAGYQIVDTWFNVGMKATGSNTLILEDVVVPAHRSFDRADLIAGQPIEPADQCHRVPLRAANGLSFAAPLLGGARGALRAWSDWYTEKSPPDGRSDLDLALSWASGQIDAAELLLRRAAAVADRGAVAEARTMRNWRDCSLATEFLVDAVHRLLRSAGTSGQHESHPLQRFWRDVTAGASHVALKFESAATAYARAVRTG